MIKKKKIVTSEEIVTCDYCKEEIKDIVAILDGDFHHSCLVKKIDEDLKQKKSTK